MDADDVGLPADTAPVADTAPLPPRALLPLPGRMMLLAMPPSRTVLAPTRRAAQPAQRPPQRDRNARVTRAQHSRWPSERSTSDIDT